MCARHPLFTTSCLIIHKTLSEEEATLTVVYVQQHLYRLLALPHPKALWVGEGHVMRERAEGFWGLVLIGVLASTAVEQEVGLVVPFATEPDTTRLAGKDVLWRQTHTHSNAHTRTHTHTYGHRQRHTNTVNTGST